MPSHRSKAPLEAGARPDSLRMKALADSMARRLLPVGVRRRIVRLTRWPPVGLVWMVGLGRRRPVSAEWGFERGQPLDRYYIEEFLGEHAHDVRGTVMEVGNDEYVRRYGGSDVTDYDVLHLEEQRPPITIIGDLTDGATLDSDRYDCVILTQTLNAIYDLEAAIATVYRILKPGGVVLATVPGISKICRYDMDRWGYYWSFTTASARRVFESAFREEGVSVGARGNVSTAIAFLHGLSSTELRRRVLSHDDPDFQVLVTVRAVKPE